MGAAAVQLVWYFPSRMQCAFRKATRITHTPCLFLAQPCSKEQQTCAARAVGTSQLHHLLQVRQCCMALARISGCCMVMACTAAHF